MPRGCRVPITILACLVCLTGTALPQIDRAVLTGTVTDPAGAVVPNASVTATNVSTGVQSRTVTTGAGVYSLPALIAGSYEIAAEAAGFKKFVRRQIVLSVGDTARIDATLEVGAVTEQIEVTSGRPMLQTDTTELSTTVNPKAYLDLPLAMGGGPRNPGAFVMLAPGVTGNAGGYGNLNINGSQRNTTEIVLDGGSLELAELKGDLRALTIAVDAVSEFTLTTNNYSAEFGRTGGGVSSFQTKSGSNNFHGATYEYLRNNEFDARGFYLAAPSVNRQNEFGVSVGGPIIRNRSFFFFNFDAYEYRRGASNTYLSVPQPDWLKGNFASLVNPNGSLIQLYDPHTTRQQGGQYVRDPYQRNQIPASQLSQVAQNIAAYFPKPQYDRLTNNYLASGSSSTSLQRSATRIDHMLTQKQNISFTWHWQPVNDSTPSTTALPAPLSNARGSTSLALLGRLSHTFTITPTVINYASFSATRADVSLLPPEQGKNWAQKLGLKGVYNGSFPEMSFSSGVQGVANDTPYARHISNTYEWNDNVTLVRGKHNMKFGFNNRSLQEPFTWPSTSGIFNFSELLTGMPGNANTGYGFASFMIGAVQSGSLRIDENATFGKFGYWAWFAQDTYKVTPKLTLNLGLRYEIPQGLSEKYNRTSNFDATRANPGANNLPGALVFAPKEGVTRFWETYTKSWGPRVGVAYSLTPGTVIRTGYGIFYGAGNLLGGYPQRAVATGWAYVVSRSSLDQGLTEAFSFDNGFPTDYQKPPLLVPDLANGSGVTWIRSYDTRPPYMQNWSFNIQRTLPGSFLVDMGYVGTKGTRLPYRLENITQLPLSTLLNYGRACLVSNIDSQSACAAPVARPFPAFKGSVSQALRRFPQYNGVSTPFAQAGSSTYHSIQIKVEKRFSQGLNLLVAYTGQKAIDNSSRQLGDASARDTFNPGLEKSISQDDVPQRIVMSFNYELPFGRGKRFGPQGLAGKLVGGWQLNGILTYQKGTPLRISATNLLPIFNGGQQPDRVAGSNPMGFTGKFDPAKNVYINRAAFTDPQPNAIGNSARYMGDLRSFPSYNEDVGIMKRFAIREAMSFTFRFEAFNLFNRVIFGGPGTNYSSQTTFGIIGSQANSPRQMQISGRFDF